MKEILKARKGGFTLIELLIVIMIVAILAGMMMLTMGSATDSAEATRIINDVRTLKSAALMYAMDNNGNWPDGDWDGTTAPSLDQYLDRPLFTNGRTFLFKTGTIAPEDGEARSVDMLGIAYSAGSAIPTNVITKLKERAEEAGMYDEEGNIYDSGQDVLMVIRSVAGN